MTRALAEAQEQHERFAIETPEPACRFAGKTCKLLLRDR